MVFKTWFTKKIYFEKNPTCIHLVFILIIYACTGVKIDLRCLAFWCISIIYYLLNNNETENVIVFPIIVCLLK